MRGHEQQPDRVHATHEPRRRPASADAHVAARVGGELTPAQVLALQRRTGNTAVATLLQRSTVPGVLRSAGRPLAEPEREDMEARLGADFTGVRVHDDHAARTSAAEVGARAYTSGEHVVLGRGGADRHTLAHELTHVLQQRAGAVAGTETAGGLRVSDPSDRFERAAEANATRALRSPKQLQLAPETAEAAPAGTILQRLISPPAIAAGGAVPTGFQSSSQVINSRQRTDRVTLTSDGNNPVGSPPQANASPPGWDYIQQLGLTQFWIRFHLINALAGGPGSADNLVPASKGDNSRYEKAIESALKADVTLARATQGHAVFFGAEIYYHTTPAGTLAQQAAAPYFPTSIIVSHQYFDGTQWTARPNDAASFVFLQSQPQDPGTQTPIATITSGSLDTIVPANKGKWSAQQVGFLNSLGPGGALRTEWNDKLAQVPNVVVADSVRYVFDQILVPSPSTSGRTPRTTAAVGSNKLGDLISDTAMSQLCGAIANGRIQM